MLVLSSLIVGFSYAPPSANFKSHSDIICGLNYLIKSDDLTFFSKIISKKGVEFGAVEDKRFKDGFGDYIFSKREIQKIAKYKKRYPDDNRHRLTPLEYEAVRLFEGEKSYFLSQSNKIKINTVNGRTIIGKINDKNTYLVVSYGELGEAGAYAFWFINENGVYRLARFSR